MRVKNRQGGVLIEFMMVVSIFISIAFIGFELSSCLKQRRLAISLSKEIANSVYKDCPDMIDKEAQRACLQTTLEPFNAISRINTEGTFFRVGVHWDFTNVEGSEGLDPSAMYYTCKNEDLNCTLGSAITLPGSVPFKTPVYNNTSASPPITIPLQISVDLAIKYTPVITSVASLFGLQDGTYFYARTIL